MDLVTGAMGSLLNKLGNLLKEEYKLQRGVREQVQSLSRELEIMHAALHKVSEVPREQLDPLVKLWAHDVKELSYDLEDIIDTVHVEDGYEATPNPHWLRKLMEKMGNWFSKGKACHQIANMIKDIKDQVQEVANRHGRYTVDSIVAKPAATSTINPRLLALYKDVAQLIGIDGPRDVLINMLSDEDDVSNKKKMKIVSIVGFGGLGKTTLAKAVYDNLKAGFDCCAFVLVGQNPDMKKVLRDILIDLDKRNTNLDVAMLDERKLISQLRELLDKQNYTMLDEKQLIEKLRDFLENKRCSPLAMACCSLLLIVVTSSCLLLVGCDPLGDSAASAAVNDESAMMERFIRWMAVHKRSYSSEEEKQRRFQIYVSNMRYIEEVNAKGLSYVLGKGPFADMTQEEFVARHTGTAKALAKAQAVDNGAVDAEAAKAIDSLSIAFLIYLFIIIFLIFLFRKSKTVTTMHLSYKKSQKPTAAWSGG